MNTNKTLVSCLLIVFTAFLFPTLRTACSSATGDFATVIQAFPYVLLVIEIAVLGYSIGVKQ